MNEDKIRGIIIETASSYVPDDDVRAFAEAFRRKYGDNLSAVVYYGSCLTSKMAKPSSFRDFFVIIDDYKPLMNGVLNRIIIPLMPPNQYFMSIERDGRKLDTKYHLLTLKDFRRLGTAHAPDHYIIGRMSKRTALVWARDDSVQQEVFDTLVDSFFSNARVTVPLIDEPVDFEGFVLSFIRTSYMSELRMETAEKFEQIFNSEREYYESLYKLLAENLVQTGQITLRNGTYRASAGGSFERLKSLIYLWKSKIRHVARFPRLILAMDNWLEQLLGKFERTYGRELVLTEREKKHKLLTAIKYFYKLKISKSIGA